MNSTARTSEASALTSGVACNQTYLGNQRKNANNAMAAALMMSAQSHPPNEHSQHAEEYPCTAVHAALKAGFALNRWQKR